MRKRLGNRGALVLAALVLSVMIFALYPRPAGEARVSEFGRYRGYSEAVYDGSRRVSDYLTLPDGTRLAYDLVMPTRNGVAASGPLPVLFKYTPYLRSFTIFDKDGRNTIADLFALRWWQKAALRLRYWMSASGHLMDPLFRTKWLERMVRHGYAVIVVERSGTGASFGVANLSHEAGAREADAILDWIAAQSWSNGRIGMYGESFQAMVQFAAASTGNAHLKAVFPASSGFDTYGVTYAGGIYNKAFQSFFTWAMSFLEQVVTPVDSDKDGATLAAVLEQRRGRTVGEQSVSFKNYPFRDSATPQGLQLWKGAAAIYPFIERINRANVPAYLSVGWYDIFSHDAFLLYNNLTVPKRLTVRPIDHSEADESGADLDYAAEAQRWFDYWLKGIDNGIANEAPIHYYVIGASKKTAWRTSSRWPLQNRVSTPYYFGAGRSGSVASANDGYLKAEAPAAQDSSADCRVDYSASSGKKSRWLAINWPRDYPDMNANDAKGLTYTSAPLPADVEVAGHPVAHLWLLVDAADLDAFAYLEEVDGKGRSSYITEGELRVSHRKLSQAPFDNLGLPYHTHERRDFEPIPAGEAVALNFNLLPTAYRFHQGNRIRVTITFADADNFDTPNIEPAPSVRLLSDSTRPSFIEIPLSP